MAIQAIRLEAAKEAVIFFIGRSIFSKPNCK